MALFAEDCSTSKLNLNGKRFTLPTIDEYASLHSASCDPEPTATPLKKQKVGYLGVTGVTAGVADSSRLRFKLLVPGRMALCPKYHGRHNRHNVYKAQHLFQRPMRTQKRNLKTLISLRLNIMADTHFHGAGSGSASGPFHSSGI